LHGSGKNRCFASVEVELWFDSGKKLVPMRSRVAVG
jgi:hypothetical protein